VLSEIAFCEAATVNRRGTEKALSFLFGTKVSGIGPSTLRY